MIFLSYSHKDSVYADNIEKKFVEMSQKITRDVRDLKYKESIKEFMKKIRKSDYAIVLVTENYLCSSNCMFEMLEFLKEPNYLDRIIPIIKKTSDIFSIEGIIRYINYWNEKKNDLENRLKSIPIDSIGMLPEKLKHYENISRSIAPIIEELTDKSNIVFNDIIDSQIYEKIYVYMKIEDITSKSSTKLPEKRKNNKNKINIKKYNIQENIEFALKCFLPILNDIEKLDQRGFLKLSDYPYFNFQDNWHIVLIREKVNFDVSYALYKPAKDFTFIIIINDNLFLNNRKTKERKHILLTKEVCHIFVHICAYLSVSEQKFISKIKNNLNNKLNNMFSNFEKQNIIKDESLSELVNIIQLPDSYFRIGLEKVTFDYSLFYKRLLCNNETFDKYFNKAKQMLFKKLFNSYRIDDSLELIFSSCEEYSKKHFVPVEYIKKEVLKIINKYF
jgi:hypothetical protein